jgi:CBS domain containing-hemolysin-like protein
MQYKWIIKITLSSIVVSCVFLLLSETVMLSSGFALSAVLLFIFVAIGIAFDILGVAVTSSDEAPLHSMATRRVKGARHAITIVRNADKVSSFCNDVVGDISGIVSGSAAAALASKAALRMNIKDLFATLALTALVTALTIGGKACGKSIAMRQSTSIVLFAGKLLAVFKSEQPGRGKQSKKAGDTKVKGKERR